VVVAVAGRTLPDALSAPWERPHDGGHTITPAMLADVDAWLRDRRAATPPEPEPR
jgi:hypothetical protein